MNEDHDPRAGPENIRGEARVGLWLKGAALREPGCHAAPVTVRDLSPSGFRCDWPYRLQRDATVYLKLPGFDIMAARVAWCEEFVLGCRFERPLHALIFERIVAANNRAG